MHPAAWIFAASPLALLGYTYVGYPLLLRAVAARRPRAARAVPREPAEWPFVSITVPVYNEERQVRGLIESLLQLDYPADRRQILIVSDASSDATDQIVQEYAGRGVELLRVPQRGGKTAAENAALPLLRGSIIVNTDASIRFRPDSLKALISCFADPEVGVASGRDVSISQNEADANKGESGYVGYEMWVRRLETGIAGIVGASGCYYAIRAELHRTQLPAAAARDFAAPLIARDAGYRSVSVDDAVCYVPRTASLRREYRRKVRTMAGGMDTLLHFRHLLDPRRHGLFAWMLLSHKLCRWMVPAFAVPAVGGLGLLATTGVGSRLVMGGVVAGAGIAALGWAWPEERKMPRLVSLFTYAAAGNLAVLHAWVRVLGGNLPATWDPTPREVADAVPSVARE
jgi:cellulose synthase/poly-beta-1,6-N-acetylglucosamine synthase-like glycosyltransferase